MMRFLLPFTLAFWLFILPGKAQDVLNADQIRADSMLLLSPLVQMEATAAVNDMYNFKFDRAANQFRWFQEKFPEHPLPEFLLGLNEWWKIMPNFSNEQHDDDFYRFMDASIAKAKTMYKVDKENIEAAFFLSAAYGFKSRLLAERKNWRKAIGTGKASLRYLKRGRKINALSPEFMFGDALYNYYSVWIPENYKLMKPVFLFIKKGDKELGLKQLEEVAKNAFYTRTEAQYFLMRIYRSEEKKPLKALPIAQYLAKTFPDNPYFQRYYASVAFTTGRFRDLEKVSMDILDKIERKMPGYEGISGRYASYYMGYINKRRDKEKARKYFRQTVAFAESTKSFKSGYYVHALAELARFAVKDKKVDLAYGYYAKVKENTKKKTKLSKEARAFLKKNKKKKKG